jgi:toxin ParE1/3/4
VDLKVKGSPEAIKDLESIAEYIARDSEYYARAIVPWGKC